MLTYWPAQPASNFSDDMSSFPTCILTVLQPHWSSCSSIRGSTAPLFLGRVSPRARGWGGHVCLQLLLQDFAQCKDLSVKPSWVACLENHFLPSTLLPLYFPLFKSLSIYYYQTQSIMAYLLCLLSEYLCWNVSSMKAENFFSLWFTAKSWKPKQGLVCSRCLIHTC